MESLVSFLVGVGIGFLLIRFLITGPLAKLSKKRKLIDDRGWNEALDAGLVRTAPLRKGTDNCMNCHECLAGHNDSVTGWPTLATKMIVCPQCGNKRCPKASDHQLPCTGSNEPGQPGSIYRGR